MPIQPECWRATNSAGRSPFGASHTACNIATRADHDFYPTPPEATRALLSVESFDGPIWEPACGDGAISAVLATAGHTVIATDLIDRGHGQGGCDFLDARTVANIRTKHPAVRHIVTNPPYSYRRGIADKFIGRALRVTRETGGKVAMLLNLGSLCHPSRTDKWRNSAPAAIYMLDELVCWPNGDRRQAGRYIAEHRYCWVVWTPGHSGPPRLWWLRTTDFRSD